MGDVAGSEMNQSRLIGEMCVPIGESEYTEAGESYSLLDEDWRAGCNRGRASTDMISSPPRPSTICVYSSAGRE